MARLESPLGEENALIESSPETHAPEGLYTAKTLVRAPREVSVRALNFITRYHTLPKVSPWIAVSLSGGPKQPQVQNTVPRFHDIIETTGSTLRNAESQELKELLAGHGDVLLCRSMTTDGPI
jgi:hypothetical protein